MRPLSEKSPLVVSYGAGLDSTGVLVLFHINGIRPDLIIFSDVGAENPKTYAALTVVSDWCESVGFPPVTVVRPAPERSRYQNLEGNCLQNETLPSLAFGGHSCSDKNKIKVIDAFIKTWPPALEALEAGRKIIRVVGYDASPADSRRTFKAMGANAVREAQKWQPWYEWYPLRDVGLTRSGLEALVSSQPALAAALRVAIGQSYPTKSACFYCPAARQHEAEELAREFPELALRAVVMEYRARWGKHGLGSTVGLGRNWSWEAHLTEVGLLPTDWKAQATAKGLLPTWWDDHAEHVRPLREAVEAGRERLKAARKAAKLRAKELAALLESEDTSSPLHWTWELLEAAEAAVVLEEVLAEKNAQPMVGDWLEKPLLKITTEERRAKRAANKRWNDALKAAQANPPAEEVKTPRLLPLAA